MSAALKRTPSIAFIGATLAATMTACATSPRLPQVQPAPQRHGDAIGSGRPVQDAAVGGQAPGAATPVIVCSLGAATSVACKDSVVVAAGDLSDALRPLDSSSITRDELRGLGPDFSSWIAFARNAAGASDAAGRVYVDGMPAPTDIPTAEIERITVNGDPFSPEYSNPGELRINIDLLPPERRWRAGISLPSLGAGGGSPLAHTARPVSRSTSVGVSGPVPKLPLTFSANASRRFDARRPLFVVPEIAAPASAAEDVLMTSGGFDVVMSAAFVTSGITARTTFSESRLYADHAGIGGTNGPTTGQRLDSRNRRLESIWRAAVGRWVHRGGASVTQSRLSATADSIEPLVVVTQQSATGGDELAATVRQSRGWLLKHVVEAARWTVGAESQSVRVSDDRNPNPLGRFQLSSADASTSTWIVSSGRFSAAARISSVALFAERLMMATPRATLRGGVRVDWQSRSRVFLSPRIVGAARWSGVQLSAGAGLFVQAWSPDLFVLAAQREGVHGVTSVVHRVSAGAVDAADPARGEHLRAMIANGFEPRRDLVARLGIQRRFGPFVAGIEHVWTRGQSLPGGERLRDAAGLIDVIRSDRALRRHQTHVRSSIGRGSSRWSGYYRHVWSFDDSDGPLGAPARSGDIDSEWAPSAGVARHSAGMSAAVALPARMRLMLTGEARSGTPYTIVTGGDPEGLALFNDRGGRSRNAGTLPAYRRLSLSVSRVVSIPRVAWLAFDVGARVDNVTNHLNVMDVGRVAGTPLFGRPIDAAAGRSVRVWATLAR